MKIDNEGRFAANPHARAENAWLDFPIDDESCFLRAGLYDLPFSRDALTSDSKLLFMDRYADQGTAHAVGMADNTYGVMLHGRPYCGHTSSPSASSTMTQFERFGPAWNARIRPADAGRTICLESGGSYDAAGRIRRLHGVLYWQGPSAGDWHECRPSWRRESTDSANSTSRPGASTALPIAAPTHSKPNTTRSLKIFRATAASIADGWYAQFGYLFHPCDAEFCVRYETLDPLLGERCNGPASVSTSTFANTTLRFKPTIASAAATISWPAPSGLGLFDEDVFEVQLQLDF